MRTWGTLFLSVFLVIAVPAANAQDAGKIFDFLQNQIQNEVNRKQQRQLERNQRQQFDAVRQEFLSAWWHCFETDDVIRCDVALTYPYLNDVDRQQLLTKRTQLIAIQEQGERAAQQEQYQREEAARQAAADEARRREQERAAAREAQEAEARRRAYERTLAEERERAEQIRAREAVAQKVAERRTYESDLTACKAFNTYSCDRAGLSPLATDQERASIAAWRQTAATYVAVRENCRNGMLAACEVALSSPALNATDRPQLEEWQLAASPFLRFRTAIYRAGNSALSTTQATATSFRDLPASTHVMSAIAAMLAAALGFVAYRQRPRTSPHEKFEPALKSAASPIEPHQPVSATTATPVTSTATSVLNLPAIIPRQQPLAAVDTPAALKALAIADSYIADVRDNFDNEDFPAHRTTLSLAARQLDIAAKADPSARHVSEIGNEYAQDEMRARVLVQEALTWAAEKTSKACTIAERACALDPNSTHAHYVAGWLNFEHKNRDRAISLLTRAVELAPNNLDAIKLLDRAQNMTAAEIATYKATAATEGTIKAARKTWNVIKFLAWLLTVFVVFNALYACSQLKSPHQPGADASFNYLIGSWAALMALGAIMRGWDWVKAWFGRNSL